MQQELSCDQVGALITFYIEDKLSSKLMQYVRHHLKNCPLCAEKYESLIQVVNNVINFPAAVVNDSEDRFLTGQYEEFKLNLSAYIDNELDNDENIKIKRMTISNPLARRDLEDMYTFKRLLHYSFDKTKHNIRSDFSKGITSRLQMQGAQADPFVKIVVFFALMMCAILAGAAGILYL
ncbi:MAG: zf-HC2 domain-containing protein [Heliobacteriaceae bacterium]|jgi:hypothetical protein|nr:zf-HC2 domain-containing protein [Heliobacteriaceae bacterium]